MAGDVIGHFCPAVSLIFASRVMYSIHVFSVIRIVHLDNQLLAAHPLLLRLDAPDVPPDRKPIISRNVSVLENSFRAEAILIAASAVTATLGMAGFLKCGMMSSSSVVNSSRRTSRTMARAI